MSERMERKVELLVEEQVRRRNKELARTELGKKELAEMAARRARERRVVDEGRGAGPAVAVTAPASDRALFERKLAEEGIEKTSAGSVEPTGERQSGVLEVRGGALVPFSRPHKNWGHAIAHLFELRSRLTTMKFVNLQGVPGSLSISPGQFGFYSVRARPVPDFAELLVELELPPAIPQEQIQPSHPSMTEAPVARRRQFETFIEIYYPQSTNLSFSPSAFSTDTVARQVAEAWEPAALEAIIGSGNPVAMATLVKNVVDQTLGDYLAAGPRPADTSDLFFISFNERTGKATVILLAEGMVGMDPEEPVPVEPTEPPVKPPEPWVPPAPGVTPTPPIAPELGYIDPLTGLEMVVEPPPPIESTLYALHDRAISVSENGGSTWYGRPAPGTAALVDIAAGPGGIFVLDAEGAVWFAPLRGVPFVKLPGIEDIRLDDTSIPVPNGDFETGELAPWQNMTDDPAQVKNTSTPPQMPGSKYYLGRQWNVYNAQPYRVRQTIELPEEIVGGEIVATVDAYVSNLGEKATLRLLLGDLSENAVAIPTGNRNFVNRKCVGFARAPNGDFLDLVVVSGNMGVFDGSNGSSGQRVFELRRANGEVYDAPVFISIGDLDKHEQMRIPQDQVLDWFVRPGNVINSSVTSGLRYFTTTVDNQNGGVLLRDGSFSIYFKTIASSIGLNGAPLPEWELGEGPTEVEAVGMSDGEWQVLEVRAQLEEHRQVTIELEASEDMGTDVDVFFDNVRLNAQGVPEENIASALGYDAGQDGGTDIYLGADIFERRGIANENMATIPAPAEDITMAETFDTIKVASNGSGAWVFSGGEWGAEIAGPFTSVVADPIVAMARDDGSLVLGPEAAAGVVTYAAGSTIVGDRFRGGLLLTEPVGIVKHVDQAGDMISSSQQPVNASANQRRAMAMDSGRLIGWNVGTRDIYWSGPEGQWKLGNATVDGIKKVVEFR